MATAQGRGGRGAWLGMAAPRYTSYPPANLFDDRVDVGVQRAWLAGVPAGSAIGVYLHIPFCRSMCWYCGCHTGITRRPDRIAAYVDVLLTEIAATAAALGGRGRLTSIHFGGGSPSLLTVEQLGQILAALDALGERDPAAEVAIEIDPRTMVPGYAEGLGRLGFNRASLGVQDFDPKVQAAINRIQPRAQVEAAVRDLRAAGITDLNFDLIYGLPHQTPASVARTVDEALELGPRRVALFSYAHMPNLKKHQGLIPDETLPSSRAKLAMYLKAQRRFLKAGFAPIGMDHFAHEEDELAVAAKAGTLARNFQGYAPNPPQTVLGFGVSSISQFREGYAQNTIDEAAYRARVRAGQSPIYRGWTWTAEDRVRKAVIDALMCLFEVDLAVVIRRFGLASDHFAAEIARLKPLEDAGVIRRSGSRIEVVGPHRMAVRAAAAVFDTYLGSKPLAFSRVA